MERNVKKSIKNWLKDNSDGNDSNLIYMYDNGWSGMGKSWIYVDSNRNGDIETKRCREKIYDHEVNRWLPDYGEDGINRLTFLAEACHCGNFLPNLSQKDQNRIIIATTGIDHCIGHETGQDWPAFTRKFFKEMSFGNKSVAEAYNITDEYIEEENFLSIKTGQDPKLDDDGDKFGSDYDLGNLYNWHRIYQGIFPNQKWVTKKIDHNDYYVTKARVRFKVRRGLFQPVTAKLYEFDFHNAFQNASSIWVSPDGHNDPKDAWDDEENAYDNKNTTSANCTVNEFTLNFIWTPYLELTLSEPLKCDKIRFNTKFDILHCRLIDVWVYFRDTDGYLAAKTGL